MALLLAGAALVLLLDGTRLARETACLAALSRPVLLVAWMALVRIVAPGPDWSRFGVHPLSLLRLLVYGLGLRWVVRARRAPMWPPQRTAETRFEAQAERGHGSAARSLAPCLVLAARTAGAGWVSRARGRARAGAPSPAPS